MTIDELLDETESLGLEWSFHPEGGLQFIQPILDGAKEARLNALVREMTANIDAYHAAVELRLWRREGVI